MTDNTFKIDTFRPEDARGVTELFKEIYGEGYPIKLVYDPAKLVAAFEARDNVPVVARADTGKVVGYCSLYRSAPNQNLYEAGQGLVNPDYRGSGINNQLFEFALDSLAVDIGAHVIFGEPVCNHVYMQKTCIAVGYVETGLEIDLMPVEAYVKEKSSSGRVATVMDFRVYRPQAQTVYLPAVYKEYLQYLYEPVHDPRTYETGVGSDVPPGKTVYTTQIFDFAQVARVAFSHAGEDFTGVVRDLEKDLFDKSTIVIQFWLKLDKPWVDSIVRSLRERGYFFGGLLPRWFGEDAILMQKIASRPNWEGITLYSDRAREILRMVKEDWEKTV